MYPHITVANKCEIVMPVFINVNHDNIGNQNHYNAYRAEFE